MAIHANHIKKDNTTRLYYAKGTWMEKNGQIYSQEYIISAHDKGTAIQIAHNHLPAKFTRDISPKPGDTADIIIRDYGMPLPNRTYYSSPIFPNTYKSVMPGPAKNTPIASNSIDDTNTVRPVIIQQVQPPEKPQVSSSQTSMENTNIISQPDEDTPQTENTLLSENNETINTTETENEIIDTNDEDELLEAFSETEDTTTFEQPTTPPEQPNEALETTNPTKTKEENEELITEELKWATHFAILWGVEVGRRIYDRSGAVTDQEISNMSKLANCTNKEHILNQWAKEYVQKADTITKDHFFDQHLREFLNEPKHTKPKQQ